MSGRLPRPKGMKAVETKQVAKPYEPKLEERAAIAAYLTWKRGTSPAPAGLGCGSKPRPT